MLPSRWLSFLLAVCVFLVGLGIQAHFNQTKDLGRAEERIAAGERECAKTVIERNALAEEVKMLKAANNKKE